VGRIDQALVGRVGVHRGEQAALDAERIVQDLGQRCGAVGGAARVADDAAVLGDDVVVDAHDQRGLQGLLARHRQQHAPGAGVQVPLQLVELAEPAAALHHVVGAELAPGQLAGVGFREHLERVPVDDHGIAVELHGALVGAVDAVVLEGIGQIVRIGQIVDGDDVVVTTQLGNAGDGPADASETVDGNSR
jgi:hypothetical protein